MRRRSMISMMIMAAAMLIPTTGCLKSTANTVSVNQTDEAASKKLSQADGTLIVRVADELYGAANIGNRQLAYASLVKLEKEAHKPGIRSWGEPSGWEAFDNSIQEAKKALSGPNNNSAAYLEASRLKLAVDALYQKAPLWLQYREIIEDDMDRLQQSWVVEWEDRPSAELAALQVLRTHVERFEIAALLERPEEKVASFQEQLRRMEFAIIYAAKSGEVAERNKMLDDVWSGLALASESLFQQDGAITKTAAGGISPAVPPGFFSFAVREQLATMFIAAFVMSVLGFAGWRKYKFEENHGASYPPPKSPWDK